MKRPVVVVIVLAVLIGAGIFVTTKIRATSSGDQTQYKVAVVSMGQVKKTISATGMLQPWTTVDIKSKAGGRINALLVDVGSEVKANQVIARIDPSDTLLSVNSAQASIDNANAKKQQSQETYALQVQQSQIGIANAQASLASAKASRADAAAKLSQARSQAAAQPKQTAAAIAQARASYNQAIKERAALNSTTSQDRAAAKSTYDQAVANEKNAKASLARQVALVQKGYVAQQTVDAAQATADVASAQTISAREKLNTIGAEQQANIDASDARVAQAKATLQNTQAGAVDIATKQSVVAQAQASLAQADAQVAIADAALRQAIANQANNGIKRQDIVANQATIAGQTAQLINAKQTLAQTTVRAPSEGVVLVKYVSEGTIITSGLSLSSTGTSIVQLGDVSRMFVNVTVDETDIANVDPGQTVEVSFDAYQGVPFDGKVTRVDPLAVVTQNVTTFNVRVEIDNSTPTFRLLKPGMNATCDFIVDDKDNVLSVPSEAVQSDDQGSYVQVATGGTPAPADPTTGTRASSDKLVGVKLTRRTIEPGLEGDDSTQIKTGLKEGERVVTQTIIPVVKTAATGTSSPFAGGGGRGGGGGGRGGR